MYCLFRIKQQMSNQCFEMAVQLSAGMVCALFSWYCIFMNYTNKALTSSSL